MKNFIANIPVYIAKPFQGVSFVNYKVAEFFIGIGAGLHIRLKTETGAKLLILEEKTKKMMEVVRAAEEQLNRGNPKQPQTKSLLVPKKNVNVSAGDDRLLNIIKGK